MNPSRIAAVAGVCNISFFNGFRVFLIALALLAGGQAMAQTAISEIRIDQSSADDDEYFELAGSPGGSLDGMTYLVIGDGAAGSGVIEAVVDLTGLAIPESGYFVAAESTFTLATADLTANLNFENSDNVTHLLVANFIGANGDDLDTDDDGVLDIQPWDSVMDCVALVETPDSGDQVYCDDRVGPDGSFVPGHAFDCPVGWEIGGFTLGEDDTPGVVNICAEPEFAPGVASTSPAADATGVAIDANVEITFNEEVNAAVAAFDIDCATSGGHTFALSGEALAFTLNPEVDFVYGEECTVTVLAEQVTDVDANDPPDNMEANYVFSFTVEQEPVDSPLVINEVDADQDGTDAAEFVEVFDGGLGNTPLDGVVMVFFNGSDDASYLAFDLDGLATDADGYFVLCGDAANTPNCDLDVSPDTNLLQNGADAVALYLGDAADFPNDTPVGTNLLIDALVYDTNEADDAGLLPLLRTGQPQVNEDGDNNSEGHSNQRCPNGAGGARNTVTYTQAEPTPGMTNNCLLPVINEVDADQTSTDTAEFVELFVPGGEPFALDGFSLVFYNGSDDASYTEFAFDLDGHSTNADGYFVLCGNAATVANCDLDVSPDSNLLQNGADAVALVFGDADDYPNDTPVSTVNLVDAIVYDTGAGDDAGLLVLLNEGQPQVNENGESNSALHSNQRCPNGFGGHRNTDSYVQASPTPGALNQCGPVEIFTIQGIGGESAYTGFYVHTIDNIVTAVGPDAFFMQTPTARSDANVDSSDGIRVYTDGAPTVAVGDRVNVSGYVVEYYGLTSLAGSPVVSVVDSGNDLPAPVILNGSVPSPNPAAPSCAIEFECYENMLVEIANGAVTGGNQYFGSDPVAEVYISAGPRAFREPGVEYPGLGGSIPTWDGNPEVFELDANKLMLPNPLIFAGSTFNATGVIGFEFGGYELWPTELSLTNAVVPMPVRAKMAGETTIGSLNLFRVCDGSDDCAARLVKFSHYIRDILRAPDILAVQEAMDLGTLQALADQIALHEPEIQYTPYLIEGNDVGGIDVGFLVRGDRVAVDSVMQLGAGEIFDYEGSLLHDRPPLLLEGRYKANGRDFPLAVMVVHNRSLNGIDTLRVQLKRLAQAESIAAMVQSYQSLNPRMPLTVVGDFNAFEFTDGYVDVVGHIKGSFNPAESLHAGADLVSPDLVNQVDLLDPSQRYSFIYQGSAQALDHALTNAAAESWVRGMAYGRGNADVSLELLNDGATPLRSSDHDGLVVFMMTDFDGDGVADDVDGCPMNRLTDVPDAELGCEVFIPTLNPAGLAMLLLLLGGLGAYTIRYRGGV